MSRGRRGIGVARGLLVPLLLLAPLGAALGEARQVHGESASFAGRGLAIAWGILRGTSEEDTWVVLRIARAGGGQVAVSVDGVDPFTGRRREILGRQPLPDRLDVRTARATFADLPRREVHVYPADQPSPRPSLTVFFLGVPDTTPEFTSEAALGAYLESTLAKLSACPPCPR